MSHQSSLDFSHREPVPASRTIAEPERKRLSRQNRRILERLMQGPVTNHELGQIALKYSGRMSELKAAGYDYEIITRDRVSGRCVYRLKPATESGS